MSDYKKIAVIGNYLPRKCGIATFTYDLVNALTQQPDIDCQVLAMNDTGKGYRYSDKVSFEIRQNRIDEYRSAADFINASHIDAVSLQHEYGIFGGDCGEYIITLLRKLRMPIVTTLHTILDAPSPPQKKAMDEICRLSSRLVVMSEKSIEFLKKNHDISEDKIKLIYHGIPDFPFVDPVYYKDFFSVERNKVIMTFGLISPNKGIEYAIDALPAILEQHPEVIYFLVGALHPHVKRERGDEYIRLLQLRAKTLNVDKNVRFINRFVDAKELVELLGAADIYLTPYLSEKQIVSGTLSYAMGAGKAIVSTPYWHAAEVLDDGRGILVNFQNSKAISDGVNSLLNDPVKCNAIRKQAYNFSRSSIWKIVGKNYTDVFSEVKYEWENLPKIDIKTEKNELDDFSLPNINLDHFEMLTDRAGILQHATFSVPNFDHGYCIDDNARALIVAVLAHNLMPEQNRLLNLQKLYIAFIMHAYNEKAGQFRNFLPFSRQWIEKIGSEDSQGRTIWGLGVCAALSKDKGCANLSTSILHNSFPILEKLTGLRSMSYALLGLHAYLSCFMGNRNAQRIRNNLATKLFEKFQTGHADDWPWYEDILTYGNAKIPQALILSGHWMDRSDMLEVGFKSLDWLIDIQTENNHFSPIGCKEWFVRGKEKSRFDQQPIEAHGMLEACLLAFKITKNSKYKNAANMAFNWYLGQNDLNTPLYDFSTGGCRDGITPAGISENQGAESTLSWLLSLLYMHTNALSEVDSNRISFLQPSH